MKHDSKQKALTGLKKTQGLLTKIQKMIEGDAYCMDIAQQINAAMGLLRKANAHIVESHLHTCAQQKLCSKDSDVQKQFIAELLKVLDVSSRK